jgi:hypothetical protein
MPWRPVGLWDVEAPIFSRQSAHRSVRLSALRAGCLLLPGIFLVLISVRGWVDPRAIMQLTVHTSSWNYITHWRLNGWTVMTFEFDSKGLMLYGCCKCADYGRHCAIQCFEWRCVASCIIQYLGCVWVTTVQTGTGAHLVGPEGKATGAWSWPLTSN